MESLIGAAGILHAAPGAVKRGRRRAERLLVFDSPEDGKLRLDLYLNYERLTTVSIDAAEARIGRRSDCDVRVEGDDVSRVHAVVRKCEGGHEIEDLSANGTSVNGQRLDGPRRLSPGDVIFISRYVLVYEPDSGEDERNTLVRE